MFMEGLRETLNEDFNTSVTENGAVGYRTTGKELLDLNFSVTSMRNWTDDQIEERFAMAYIEDKLLAVKWLFFARDIRGGIGERKLFRICLKYLSAVDPELVKRLIPLVPEYGRWDDLWCLLDCNNNEIPQLIVQLVYDQLCEDYVNLNSNKPISLVAKWLPSANTSSKETKRLARIFIKKFGVTEKVYRQMLSESRSYLKIVETKMSSKDWASIDYSAVPSRANLIYGNAFLRNDEERRRLYLESLQKGEIKINAGVLFPHDIIHKYRYTRGTDTTLEGLWKALPDYMDGAGNTICVADGSGSMYTGVGNTDVTALDVANGLAIYFAERSSGQFKDNYITFSEHPQLVDLSKGESLRDKLTIARYHNEIANTNIEAVFDLILQTAINKHMSQEDLPQNILILSDMEFDNCVYVSDTAIKKDEFSWWEVRQRPTKKLFQVFAERYAKHGYKLPRLVFWNICSRTGTIPVKENDLGVALVSGFSPAIVKMVLSNSTDPFECLLEQLNSERYKAVEEAVI